MTYTSATWPIGAALLQFPGVRPDGSAEQDAAASRWAQVFREVRLAGFDHVDLTDSWVRPGDLTPQRQDELARCIAEAGLGVTAISAVRRSVIDPDPVAAEENLAYSLRTVEAAARMGVPVVSIGLHRALSDEQQEQLWFWTAEGAKDPEGDVEMWDLAVERIREVGELGAQLGVKVSLEMYEDTYLGTADSTVALIRDIDHPNVGVNPDIGNLVRLHRPVEDWQEMLTKLLPHTNYWHVKNYFRDEDRAKGIFFASPAPMELGVINYRRALEMALEAGFDGPICVEHYGGDGLSVSAANRDYIRRILVAKLPE